MSFQRKEITNAYVVGGTAGKPEGKNLNGKKTTTSFDSTFTDFAPSR